jgi:hypothetical protein
MMGNRRRASAVMVCLVAMGVIAHLVVTYLLASSVTAAGQGHTDEQMARVMAGRYAFMAFLLAVFVVYRDFRALTVLFSGFVFLSLIDIAIYAAAGAEVQPHLIAAILSLIGVLACASANQANRN